MLLTPEPVTLNLRTAFRIAHGVSHQRFNVFAHLDEGIGEGAVVPYYGDTQQGLMDYIAAAADRMGDDPFLIEDILDRLPPGPQAAKAAIDIALHDLIGKRLGQPLYRLFGVNPDRLPQTSFTIAMDEPAIMAQRAAESGLAHHQDQAGQRSRRSDGRSDSRRDFGEAARRCQRRLDARTGRAVDSALEAVRHRICRTAAGRRRLRRPALAEAAEPRRADLRRRKHQDLARYCRHADAIDGVVIKLMKTGGLREALRAIHIARAHGLQIMLSCMVETSVGVTAAAHLAPLCDYADLDGPLLIANDPYRGVRFEGAHLILPDGPGLGVIVPCD